MHRFRYDGTGPARFFRATLPPSRIVSIGKSGGEGANSLGRPTFVEHAIAAVPLPYLGTSTIVALLAKGPGYLLARLIENGGDRNQTVAEIFGDALALLLGDRSAHGGGEASRHGYREFTGRGCLRAPHRRKPDLRTQSARSARPAPPHARILLHREEERRIQTLPTWPFETRAMTRIAAITLIGVVAVLGCAIVDYFLLR